MSDLERPNGRKRDGAEKGRTLRNVRDRVVGLRRVKARELRLNASNWREHPTAQRELMLGLLGEVGYVDALIARELPDGSLELIDGHMRSDLTPDAEVPVLVVDLDDAEADKVLATLDPVSAMAEKNSQLLADLANRTETQNADIRRLLMQMGEQPKEEPKETELSEEEAKGDVPGMQLEPHEHYDFLVVCCTTTQEWNLLCERLNLKPEQRRGRMGTSRAIHAEVLLGELGVNL